MYYCSNVSDIIIKLCLLLLVGLQQQGMAAPGSQHMAHSARGRPPRPPAAPPSDDAVQPRQQKKVPMLEKHLVDQLSKEEQSSLSSKFQEAMDADKKVMRILVHPYLFEIEL